MKDVISMSSASDCAAISYSNKRAMIAQLSSLSTLATPGGLSLIINDGPFDRHVQINGAYQRVVETVRLRLTSGGLIKRLGIYIGTFFANRSVQQCRLCETREPHDTVCLLILVIRFSSPFSSIRI